MTYVDILKDKTDKIFSVKINDHSGYDDAGKDIVCAAISALSQTILHAMTDLLKANIDFYEDSEQTELFISKNEQTKECEKLDLLFDTLYLGLKSIECEYGDYLKINERRC